MEAAYEFQYLGSLLCKCESMSDEMREWAEQGRKVVGSLGWIMKEKND